MGIPGLYSLLRPYAQPFTFPSPTPGSEQSTRLYIDGPALAYHVYHTSLNANYYDSLGRVRRNPFDAVVEYDEFVEHVGSFLARLEGVGFAIQNVFFDGYLPKVKLPTRLSRLSHSLSQLITYHSLHPIHIPSFNSSYRQASSSTRPTPAPRQHSLPSPPFIVSTALSYLIGSKWGKLVETVPGEADAWCASAAVRRGGWVMSGDTDLLLYGHGEDGFVDEEGEGPPAWGVMMFRDFDFFQDKGKDGNNHWVAKAMVFHPNHLSKALFGGEDLAAILGVSPKKGLSRKKKGVKTQTTKSAAPAPAIMDQFNQAETAKSTTRLSPSLLNLAYHLQNEPCAGMARLKQLVKTSSLLPDMSQREIAFRREYALVTSPPLEPREKPEGKKPDAEVDIGWQLKHLDPRFSELVYHLPCLSNKVHPPILRALSPEQTRKAGEVEEVKVDSFLPFLYEDPTRSGAWDVGRDIRGVVYGILEAYQNKVSQEQDCVATRAKLVVREHVRRGKRIKDVVVEGVARTSGEGVKQERVFSQVLADYIETWKDKWNKPSTKGSTKRDRRCECSNYWWVGMIVEMVVWDYAEKGKGMPLCSEVGVIVHMLSQAAKGDGQRCGGAGCASKSNSTVMKTDSGAQTNPSPPQGPEADSPQHTKSGPPPRWTWSMIHLFAQVQAGVYSLWMLKQLMVFALALGDTLSTEEKKNMVDLAALLHRVPPVENVIAGKRFLEGLSRQQDGVDRHNCEVCGFGEDLIMGALIEKWHSWGVESEGMDMGEDEASDAREAQGEGEEQGGESRAIWGGMEVDF